MTAFTHLLAWLDTPGHHVDLALALAYWAAGTVIRHWSYRETSEWRARRAMPVAERRESPGPRPGSWAVDGGHTR